MNITQEEVREIIDSDSVIHSWDEDLPTVNTQKYYKGKDSLYKFAEDWKLNSWEFDLVKRVVRCRHKGTFEEDLQKTKNLIDIYIKEYEEKR